MIYDLRIKKFSRKVITFITIINFIFSSFVPHAFAQSATDSANLATTSSASPSASISTSSANLAPDTTNIATNSSNIASASGQNPFADYSSSASFSLIQSLSNLISNSLVSSQNLTSGILKQPMVIDKLQKRNYKSTESINLVVSNAAADDIQVAVTDLHGHFVNNEIEKQAIDSQHVAIIIHPPKFSFLPGKYTVFVTDSQGNTTQQDFTWGVLAINTNKSIYSSNETAAISIAVLNEVGKTVCDANVNLDITDPNGKITHLSTSDNSIKVNSQCNSYNLSLTPDYSSSYTVGGVGNYSMTLSATTKNGKYTIDDGIVVSNSIPFDIERITATRIYPVYSYPVTLNIKANQDFKGTITDYTPASFDISESASGSATPYETSLLYTPPADMLQQFGVNTLSLGTPFTGNFPMVQGFGVQMTDPDEAPYYASFGLAGHDGLDFAMGNGTPIIASDDGVVILAGEGAYGTQITLKHSWGQSYYGHLSKLEVKAGDHVVRGEEIGLSGMSGHVTGPHLHFGIRPLNPNWGNGFYGKVDPSPFLAALFPTNQSVLGISSTASLDTSQKLIIWNVSLKKGDSIDLNYTFKTPNISPQFYTMGPLTFRDAGKNKIFEEARQWQIAVDSTNFITTTGTQSFTVPSDWNSSNNFIETVGGGGGGGGGFSGVGFGGGGGGGGAYSKQTNVTLTQSSSVQVSVGAAGVSAGSGGDSWFCSDSSCTSITSANVKVGAKGGGGGTSGTGSAHGIGGSGGSGASGVGSTTNSGGLAGNGGTAVGSKGGSGGGGGGGAGGCGAAACLSGSLGSDGSPGVIGTSGSNSGGPGGAGGNGDNGHGGGGGGGGAAGAVGTRGGDGTEWTTHGSGGGGGGGGGGGNGAAGGNGGGAGSYGAGGGAGGGSGSGSGSTTTGSAGSQGLIIYTYTPAVTTPTTSQLLRHGEWFNNGVRQNFFWG